jgi:nucleotide-binding universal stress UspA family protein
MHPFRTIVAAIDFSETSPDTLDAAIELAATNRHHLHLVHVVRDVVDTDGTMDVLTTDWDAVLRARIETARQQLVQLAAAHTLDPHTTTTAVLVGPAASEIVRYASEQAADAIVLGSHGHGLVHRFMLGTVADRVLRQASCPVMLVPHRAWRMTSFEVKAASGVES